MRGIIALSFAGLVMVLGAQQTVPPPIVPTVQKPTTSVPTVQVPQTTAPAVVVPQQVAQEGQVFEGNWSASGQRQTLLTGLGRSAVTVQLSGAVAITTGAGLSRGFRGEVIGFDDGAGSIAGRVVWTDERGDRIFSGIFGDALASAGRQMRGMITGGTGRYAGITGEYEFRWQHLIAVEGNLVNGRAVDLRGRVRSGGGAR